MATDTISLSAVRDELERAEAELRQRQEEVDQLRSFVQGFEAMLRRMGTGESEAHVAPPMASAERGKNNGAVSAEALEMPVDELKAEDRAIRELEAAGKPLSTREVADLMVANGYTSEGTGKITDTVYSVLSYAVKKKKDSRVVKVNTKWGLREWQRQ